MSAGERWASLNWSTCFPTWTRRKWHALVVQEQLRYNFGSMNSSRSMEMITASYNCIFHSKRTHILWVDRSGGSLDMSCNYIVCNSLYSNWKIQYTQINSAQNPPSPPIPTGWWILFLIMNYSYDFCDSHWYFIVLHIQQSTSWHNSILKHYFWLISFLNVAGSSPKVFGRFYPNKNRGFDVEELSHGLARNQGQTSASFLLLTQK